MNVWDATVIGKDISNLVRSDISTRDCLSDLTIPICDDHQEILERSDVLLSHLFNVMFQEKLLLCLLFSKRVIDLQTMKTATELFILVFLLLHF